MGEEAEKKVVPETIKDELFTLLKSYLGEQQFEFAKKAYFFAEKSHQGQKRVSGEEYITHPLGVCKILADLQLDEETIAAAFLHDVVEDTPVAIDNIKELFGNTVAMLVDGVTKLNKIEYISKEEQQMENYRKMFLAMAKDIRVVLIKLADRLHNMRTLKFMNPMKQRSISKETLEIFAPLAHRLGIYSIKWELEDLSFRYMEPEKYYDLVEQVKQKRREREELIANSVKELKEALLAVGVECEIQGRPKNFFSIHKKMLKSHKELNEIFDLLAIRVLVNTVKDCYGAIGVVHSLWRPIPGRFKDYVAVPKSNMYQSLHTTVMTSFGQPLEIQIRTFEMHRISEYGIAAHWRYKESKGGNSGFDEKLSWLRQLLEWHQDMKDPREFVDSVKLDVFADEVFVFTPRGDVIDLPMGSVPIDFAYRIHTDVGNRCIGAKVNGRIVPLEYKLSNGDIVEIITSKQANGPSRDWLNIARASESKNKIRQWFKRECRDDNIAKGKELLEREVKRLGYDSKSFLKPDRLKSVAQKITVAGDDNLLAALGYGGVTVQAVMTRLIELYKQEEKATTNGDMSKMLAELKTKGSSEKVGKGKGILVKGESGLLVRLAKCCNPVPGDQIVGYITRGRGVSVHIIDCKNIANNPDEYERLIEVAWDIGTSDSKYRVAIQINSNNNTGVMANIMMVASESKVSITSVTAKVDEKNKSATITLGLEVSSLDHLEYIMAKMRRVKNVYSVYRYLTSGG
ncbi:RelA/SpoT family protein [Succinispira mobilis]|uniref:RelA/SpoT family protein n=1 Tax=Succinispira mobilis TaxID=78120 RepID=UPI00036F1CA1|nr:bifunctional (p)ppGpp synthetase/guanosine-3',5'-bis(diphosphate) 3'-pyrophosphohydrolase [Succinispira mobilis]